MYTTLTVHWTSTVHATTDTQHHAPPPYLYILSIAPLPLLDQLANNGVLLPEDTFPIGQCLEVLFGQAFQVSIRILLLQR
mmetsp:Transcript_42154/g.108569  ORF Transcript_42154/g.108569 Transcript_42154/m.108569 type:complete len:80 (+) Transcript_42154:274-513(+)